MSYSAEWERELRSSTLLKLQHLPVVLRALSLTPRLRGARPGLRLNLVLEIVSQINVHLQEGMC